MVDHIKFTTEIAEDWKSVLSLLHHDEYNHCIKRIRDASSTSQLQSKLWLVSEIVNLNIDVEKVALLAGWYANFITPLLIDELGVKYILNLDSDPDVKTISYKFNKRYKIDKDHIENQDMNHIIRNLREVFDVACFYRCEMHDVMFEPIKKYGDFDLVINTSCEHMFSMSRFRKLNKSKNYIYVLQSSNDRQYDDHINCVDSADELADQADIVDVMYSGEMKLSNSMTRYMVIGR
jgi:hypothetical protein